MLSTDKCLAFQVNITPTFMNIVIEKWLWKCYVLKTCFIENSVEYKFLNLKKRKQNNGFYLSYAALNI